MTKERSKGENGVESGIVEKDAESTVGRKQWGPEGTRKWGTGRVTPSSQLPLLGSSDLQPKVWSTGQEFYIH